MRISDWSSDVCSSDLVIVGTHRGAADALYARIRGRMGTISGAKAAEKVPAQVRLARSLAQAQAAELLLEALVARNMAAKPDAGAPVHRSEMKDRKSVV